MTETLAFVGVAGGAGTTRTAVEVAATLARDGRSVAVLDAAPGTQGLARYVDGRIDPDATAVLVDEAGFEDALAEAWDELDGNAALWPTHAPFERLARAQTTDAARRFERCVRRAEEQFEHVLLDVPPLASNVAVAAATAADRRVLVAPATRRGNDHLPRMRGRLVDVGAGADGVVATRVDGSHPLTEADHELPAGDPDAAVPTCVDPDTDLAPAVADATEALLETSLDLEFPSEGLLG
ncbi:AAA family ATPase [Halomicrobium salinisoli]|uniref:AAA family ATPase n=1 Tax=Halomicrobium salinisoli TaxID=2878391 RepID=UPI001CF06E15|nr:ParA family protein [Halomicrobium salinisoli]